MNEYTRPAIQRNAPIVPNMEFSLLKYVVNKKTEAKNIIVATGIFIRFINPSPSLEII
jgi:hypothetical protein